MHIQPRSVTKIELDNDVLDAAKDQIVALQVWVKKQQVMKRSCVPWDWYSALQDLAQDLGMGKNSVCAFRIILLFFL